MNIFGTPWIDTGVTIITTIIASGGFWSWLQRRQDKTSATALMLKGLAHDRIIHVGTSYIKRGYVTLEEYDDFITYLCTPYTALGGNGTAEKVVADVKKLPVHAHTKQERGMSHEYPFDD